MRQVPALKCRGAGVLEGSSRGSVLRTFLAIHLAALYILRLSAEKSYEVYLPTVQKTCPESVALLSVSRNYLVDQQPLLLPSSFTTPPLNTQIFPSPLA